MNTEHHETCWLSSQYSDVGLVCIVKAFLFVLYAKLHSTHAGLNNGGRQFEWLQLKPDTYEGKVDALYNTWMKQQKMVVWNISRGHTAQQYFGL